MEMLRKEQDLLGSRYTTRADIIATYELIAKREVWPIVTDIALWKKLMSSMIGVEKGK